MGCLDASPHAKSKIPSRGCVGSANLFGPSLVPMIAVPVVLKCSPCLPEVPESKIADTSSLSRKTVSAHLDHIDGQVGASPTGPARHSSSWVRA
jgi:hypothetical protein